MSEKTGRGPLADDWLSEYWNEVPNLKILKQKYFHSLTHNVIKVEGKTQPTAKNMSLMCAYKLCRVEFRYWGMQTKLEKFIHDVGEDYVIFFIKRNMNNRLNKLDSYNSTA